MYVFGLVDTMENFTIMFQVRAPEEAEVPINQVAPPVVAPEMPVVVVERLNQNANPPPPSAEEPQPGPSNETENKNDAKTAKKRPGNNFIYYYCYIIFYLYLIKF